MKPPAVNPPGTRPRPKALRLSPQETDIVNRTVYGEARNQAFAGKAAVAWVIRNRIEADLGADGKPDWWGEGAIEVCLKRGQFSCWLPNDPNSKLLRQRMLGGQAWNECCEAVRHVFAGELEDPTKGATHYQVHGTGAAWSFRKDGTPRAPSVRIGAHDFYNDIP